MRIATLVKERGPKEAIEVIDENISSFPMMSSTHFECYELLKKAKLLIEEGKLDDLKEIDERLKSLEIQNLFE